MSRSDKVAEEIKREMGQILQQELCDPRLGFTTITRVELASDLRFARIFFSVYGNEKQWKDTAEALTHASGFIRRTLGERLELRFVPEIVFASDHSSEYSIIIEKQLEQIKREERPAVPEKRKKNAPTKASRRTAKKKK